MPDFPPEAPGYDSPVTIDVDHPDRSLNEREVADLVRRVVDGEDLHLRHVSVVLSGHDTVRHLNREYLDHDYDTDVLAFSLAEPDVATGPDVPAQPDESGAEDGADDEHPVVEGEVYVDLDTAAERHAEFDATFEREVQRYVAHGVLHLLGYDDGSDDAQAQMRTLEDRYLHAAL